MQSLLLSFILAVPVTHQAAPVYVYMTDAVLKRAGTYIYKPSDPGYRVIYCIATPPRVILTCVVHTPSDKLVLIETLPSQHAT